MVFVMGGRLGPVLNGRVATAMRSLHTSCRSLMRPYSVSMLSGQRLLQMQRQRLALGACGVGLGDVITGGKRWVHKGKDEGKQREIPLHEHDWRVLLDIADRRGPKLNPADMATLINRLSNSAEEDLQQMRSDPRFPPLLHLVRGVLKSDSRAFPHQAANVINALGKLGHHPGSDFMQEFEEACMEKLSDVNAQGAANLIHGLAKMHVLSQQSDKPDKAFLDEAVEACMPKLPDFNAQELANLIHGLASLGHRPEGGQLQRLVDACWAKLRGEGAFEEQQLANPL